MNCKNCQTPLAEDAIYCHHCGGFVKTERITMKNLWQDFAKDFFGFDNRFFFTIKEMVVRPHVVLEEYLSGVRNKYIKPASLLAISATFFVLLATIFDGQMDIITNEQYKLIHGKDFVEQMNHGEVEQGDSRLEAIKGGEKINGVMMKYFSLVTFLFIPIYAFISFLTYRKRFNYAEHIVLNSYIQGFTFLIGTVLFIVSLIRPALYYLYYPILILYFGYVMSKLHNHGIGKAMWHFIKFLFILFINFIILSIVSFLTLYA